MKFAKFFFLILCIMPLSAFADDECLHYKVSPKVNVSVPAWDKSVVQPLKPMDLLHGNLVATLSEEYALAAESEPMEDGYCIVLTGVDASVGYTDFLVHIDSRHLPDTCEYNLTLEHEDQHIRAYLSVMDDAAKDVRRSIAAAANSIMPIFVPYDGDVNAALDGMERELQNHPDIILMKQKINAEQEIRNKKVDERDDGKRINECK